MRLRGYRAGAMRLSLAIIALVAGFTAILLWLAPFVLDITPQREVLAQAVRVHTGMDMSLKGDVSLHLVPRPHLRLRDVHLRGAHGSADIKELHYFVSPLAMWRATWQPTRLDAHGGTVQLHLQQVMGDLRGQLLALPLNRLGLHDIAVQIKDIRPDTTLTLTRVNGYMQKSGGDYTLTLDGQNFTLVAEIEDLTQAKSPLALSVETLSGETLVLTGALQDSPHLQLDAEVVLVSPNALASMARRLGFAAQGMAQNGASDAAQPLRLDGFMTLTAEGLRTENTRIAAFGTSFQTQLGMVWAAGQHHRPFMQLRIATSDIDFAPFIARLSTANTLPSLPSVPPSSATSLLESLGLVFFESISGQLRLESDRFTFVEAGAAEESGRNLIAALAIDDDALRLTRLSADLPFSSSLLSAGDIRFINDAPHFKGRVSVRSADTPALLVWLGNVLDFDVSPLAEVADAPWLRRVGIVSDLSWSRAHLRFADAQARFGNDIYALDADFTSARPLRGALALRASRLDLQEWGLLDTKPRRTDATWFQQLDITPQLLRLLAFDKATDLRFVLAIDNAFAGAERIGAVAMQAQLAQDKLSIARLHFADYLNTATTLSGHLQSEDQHLHGALQIDAHSDDSAALTAALMPRLPLKQPITQPLIKPIIGESARRMPKTKARLSALLLATAPSDADWPHTTLQGSGTIGALDLAYKLRTPARDFNVSAAGSSVSFSASTRALNDKDKNNGANSMAKILGLPAHYKPYAPARFQLSMETQAETQSRVSVEAVLAKDRLAFSGLSRPDADGYRLEGVVSARGGHLLSLFGQFENKAVPPLIFDGTAQIVLDGQQLIFSNLDMQMGSGQLTGEGVYHAATTQPDAPAGERVVSERFNANLLLSDFDAADFLPRFSPKSGWSNAPMQWAALVDNAVSPANFPHLNLELRLQRLRLAALQIEEVAGNIRIIDGVLEAPNLTAALYGGTMRLALQGAGGSLTPSFTLSGQYEDVQLGDLLQTLYGATPIKAAASGGFDVRGRGRSLAQMLTALSGNMRLTTTEGTLLDDFPFVRALAVIDIGEGVISTQASNFIFAPPQTDAKFNGGINLATRALTGTLTLPSALYKLGGTIVAPKTSQQVDKK